MLTTRPFRFGVLTKGAPTRPAWLDLLARASDGGFDTLLMPVHSTPQYSVTAALADAAARTSLRIGTLVVNNDLQHPALLARDAATLSLLSDGRFELGLGAGWMPRDYDQWGIPMDPGPVRVNRLAEALDVIRAFQSGSAFSHAGEHYTIQDLTGVATEPVPLMIGAGGPRMLELAARRADIVSISRDMSAGSSPHEIARDATLAATVRKTERVARQLNGREVELNILAPHVVIGPGSAERIAREVDRCGLTAQEVVQTPENFLASSVAELAERLHERRSATGISYYVIRDQDIEACAPLVAALAVSERLASR